MSIMHYFVAIQSAMAGSPQQSDFSIGTSCEKGVFDMNGDCTFDVLGLPPSVATIICVGLLFGVGAMLRNRDK